MGFRNNKTINYQGENLFVASGQEEEQTPHEWDGMPEFNQPEAEAWKMVMVRFRNEEDLLEFGKRLEQTVTKKTTSKTTAKSSKKELPPVGSSEHKAMVLRGEIKK